MAATVWLSVERITLGKGACSRPRLQLDVQLVQRITLGKGACSRPDNQGTFVQAKSIGFGRMYVQGDSLQLEDPVISIAVMWKLEIGKRI